MQSRHLRKRPIKIHEYQARDLLQQYGIAVPRGELARSPEEAAIAVATLGSKAMIKAQVLTGGRGKAGAIRAVSSIEEAKSAASEILEMSIKEFSVKQVLVAEMLDIRAEYYAGITVDREAKSVVLIISAAGGMEIEDIAAKEPEKIRRFVMSGATESDASEALAEWLSESCADKAHLYKVVTTVVKI